MKQTETEINMLDALYAKKSSVLYDTPYVSSTITKISPELGTIEADAAGKFGRWAKEEFRAKRLAQMVTRIKPNATLLDVGGGNLLAASYFVQQGFIVDVCDFSSSPYFSEDSIIKSGIREFFNGDFNELSINGGYDVVWVSHVLEHQINIGDFLARVVSLVNDDGYLAIAVPPRKPYIVSGHLNLFNPGLLVYRMVLSGISCKEAKVFQYDGNICLLVKATKIQLPKLNYDIGDIALLSGFFPSPVEEGFNGDFNAVNLSPNELSEIFGINSSYLVKST